MTGRTLLLCAGGAVVCMAAAVGCAPPTVISPFTDRAVTGDQLAAELARAEAKKRATDLADAAKAQERVTQIKAKAEADVRQIAVQAKIDDANREKALADVTARAAVDVSAALEASRTAQAQRDAALASLRDQTEDAFKVLEAQIAQRGALAKVVTSLPIVGQAAASAGINSDGVATLATLLVGAGGMGWVNRRARDREDRAWDESAKAEKARADALQAQLLALQSQPPRANP